MAASSSGKSGIVTVMLAAGADKGATDKDGRTALMVAAGSVDAASAVEVLLKAGADPNAKDKQGRTALAIAQSSKCYGSEQVVNLLKPATTTK